MPKLLDDSDDDGDNVGLNINESYATAYERWRQKEEYQKLKDKYGEDVLSEDSVASYDESDDSSDESDEEEDLDEQVFDEEFLKVYAALKSKDPSIYEENVKFFNKDDQSKDQANDTEEEDITQEKAKAKKKKAKGMNLLEYHQALVEQEKGVTEEDKMLEEKKHDRQMKQTYVQELEDIKKEFKNFLEDDDDDDEQGSLIKGIKSVTEKPKKVSGIDLLESASSKDGRIDFLRKYWTKSDLDDREKFLKEYILEKKYLDPRDPEPPTLGAPAGISKNRTMIEPNQPDKEAQKTDTKGDSDEVDDAEENGDKEQQSNLDKISSVIESVPSYHFQESDAEVIKRYPRVIESVRDIKSVSARNLRRAEIKERKKREKLEALQRFRELKRAEIKDKLKKLQEISGNEKLLSSQVDIDLLVDDVTDFDPEKYDQRMSQLFNDDYYGVLKDGKKPKFEFIPGIDDVDDDLNPIDEPDEDETDALDPNNEGQHTGKSKKGKKAKKAKPPTEKKNIGIYEDVVGDAPTRYHYRKVVPNDFGLTPEELLLADDKELNKWVSLKKTCQYRSPEEESYDAKAYMNKKSNIFLKKKYFKSIYSDEADDNSPDGLKVKTEVLGKVKKAVKGELAAAVNEETTNGLPTSSKKPKRRGKKRKTDAEEPSSTAFSSQKIVSSDLNQPSEKKKPIIPPNTHGEANKPTVNRDRRKRNRKRPRTVSKGTVEEAQRPNLTAQRLKAYDLSNRVIEKKLN